MVMKKLWNWLVSVTCGKQDDDIRSITWGEGGKDGFADTYVNGEKSNVRMLVWTDEEINRIHKMVDEIHKDNNSFIIERNKNNRLFFITKKCELTWRKENAWKFDLEEDVRNEIKNNRLLELTAGDYYKIVKYSDAKSH